MFFLKPSNGPFHVASQIFLPSYLMGSFLQLLYVALSDVASYAVVTWTLCSFGQNKTEDYGKLLSQSIYNVLNIALDLQKKKKKVSQPTSYNKKRGLWGWKH